MIFIEKVHVIDISELLKNKKPFTRNISLDLVISVGYIIDFSEWAEPERVIDPDLDVKIELSLDGRMLYSGPVTHESLHIHHEFEDQSEDTKHQLAMSVSGLGRIIKIDDDTEAAIALRLHDIWLENLPIDAILHDHGLYKTSDGEDQVPGTIYGKNGDLSFSFSSPVYRWLLSNDSKLMRSMFGDDRYRKIQ